MCPSRRYGGVGAGKKREEPLRPAFEVLDMDGDGRIGRDDLKKFYFAASEAAATATEEWVEEEEVIIRSMIAAADADRDGFVAFEEFERVLLRRRRGDGGYGGGVMEEAFREMDRDGDGKVGFEDLRGFMEGAGLEASDDEILAMIAVAGRSGGVRFDDLLKILAVDLA
ncbi:unnamed protein product [Spirodela intermedia]|uniref:EF-hand domain-containing protein n=1 Tax=Spirodela intermedia TaxID=51605 RepID=A0A7I8JY54_SPIIN|nr:unnamed protein product [Spirodela intermedia]